MKLGELCEKDIDTIKDSYDGFIDYIDISSVNNKLKEIVQTQTIMAQEAPSRAKQIVKVGDILVSTVRPNLNAVAIVEKSSDNLLVASTGYCVLRCLPNTYNRYIFYFCQSPLFIRAMTSQETGASYPAVTSTIIKNCSLNIPTIDEQRSIAAILDKVTDLIAQRRAQLGKLDLLVKARFVEMFGDPTLNPYGLERKRFDSICENLDSRRKPITASERVAGIYPYYGASGIVDYVEDYIFDEDILLISEDGANLLMRSTPIAFSVNGKVWVNNHAHVVRFNNLATQKYIEVYFSLIDISDQVTGSAQPKLNQAKLNAMEFMYPPIDLQNQFAVFIDQINKSKLTIHKSLDKLEMMKKALMQQYFV